MTDTNNPPRPALSIKELGLEEELKRINRADAAAKTPALIARGKPNAPPEYRFMELTDLNCDAMLEAARNQVNIAQNNLKQTEAYVERLREESKRRWDAHEAYVKALEDFGMSVSDSMKRFDKANGGK